MVKKRKHLMVGNRYISRRYIGNKKVFENLTDKTEVLSGEEIYTDKADDGAVVHVEVDGKSYQEGVPNPDSPIEIHSLNDFDVVSSVGKENLLVGKENGNYRLSANNDAISPSIYKSYEDYDSVTLVDGIQLSTYSPNFTTFILEKDKEYTASMYVYSPVKLDLSIKGYSGDIWTTVPPNTWTRLNRTLIGTDEKQRLPSLYSRNAKALNHEIFYNRIKLEEGGISSYSPAPEDIIESDNHSLIDKINLLLNEPLRSVGDVKDMLFRDSDGLWKVERNVAYKPINEMGYISTFSGDNECHFNGGVAFLIYYPDSQKSFNTKDILSSHFKKTESNNFNAPSSEVNTIHQLDPTRFSIRVPESTIGVTYANTLQEKRTAFRNWNNANNVRVQYILGEPTIETLGQELQDKLNNLRSFQDSNYVYTVINDKTDILPTVAENLKPTLHTTFKSKGWYDYYLKTLLK